MTALRYLRSGKSRQPRAQTRRGTSERVLWQRVVRNTASTDTGEGGQSMPRKSILCDKDMEPCYRPECRAHGCMDQEYEVTVWDMVEGDIVP